NIDISKDTTENHAKPSNNYVPEVEKSRGLSDCKCSISIYKERSYSGVFQPELLSLLKPSFLYGSPESLSRLSEFLRSSVYQNSLSCHVKIFL
ncbi:19093_t:CDS:2, partial [Dentiscutata erythropus]